MLRPENAPATKLAPTTLFTGTREMFSQMFAILMLHNSKQLITPLTLLHKRESSQLLSNLPIEEAKTAPVSND